MKLTRSGRQKRAEADGWRCCAHGARGHDTYIYQKQENIRCAYEIEELLSIRLVVLGNIELVVRVFESTIAMHLWHIKAELWVITDYCRAILILGPSESI